jgi:large subunit ribosomal protein L17
MRHHNSNRKFGRVTNQRVALLNSLARALILKEKISTSLAKAKELRPYVEKLITAGKKNTVFSRRLIMARLGNDIESAKKLNTTVGARFLERHGGYTRITKLPSRKSDGSPRAVIEFVE